MMSDFYAYIHFVFIGFIALFPVVNPLGSAFIVSPYFSGLSNKQRVNAVKKIAFYVLILCLFVLLTGHWILELFGISVPIIQLAGGIMICKIGWDFLTPKNVDDALNSAEVKKEPDPVTTTENNLFYPITFPITAGAGTISVLITLSAHGSNKHISQYLTYISAIMLAVIGMCFLVFICYVNANRLIHYLGSHREKIVNTIMAFLIFCVGLQIAVEGITQLIK